MSRWANCVNQETSRTEMLMSMLCNLVGHSWKPDDGSPDSCKCKRCGSLLAHDWAGCRCKRCGKSKAHDWDASQMPRFKKCRRCGEVVKPNVVFMG